ncbi:MAG: sigma-54-dependent Fis family transcriptional regulator [Marinicaulis sp.]|nr:sigma-54 dependent transcriptional regulator [Marinicaulis sp.]NNE42215.1 sigma-54-dependent Fis family transcriptional regulator [Marinicaulis sp.]NNL89111.1 sigma-54-dependent Fis family transcriptional regulator [Marinicaulis sp.]
MSIDILVVDDEEDIRELVSGILEDEGYAPRTAAHSDAALAAIRTRLPALVVLDVWLQNSALDGIEILEELKKLHPELPVVIISGHGTIETAVAAIKKGAYDFIEKPFNADKLLLVVNRALETMRLRRENTDLRARNTDSGLVGRSNTISALRGVVDRVAVARSRVLISGPPGSGKEVIARLIHKKSPRAEAPFVVASAASIAPERMEEELFGTEGRGGSPEMIGVMERAHGGTLMFDEIGDMPIETQGKILRVLVDQRFKRVGGVQPVEVDVRIVSTTSRDLLADAQQNQFREDLFHRLNVVSIIAPGLDERRDDIPELCESFMEQISLNTGLPKRKFSGEAMAALQTYNWPGNIRQLRNVIERTQILMGRDPADTITCEHLPSEVMDAGLSIPAGDGLEQIIALPLREARDRFEREYLITQINRFGGNISRTATFIGMERSALHRKLKALGVTSQSKAASA